MPAPLAQVLAEADRLLEPSRFDDYGPNGLQVPGRGQVSTLLTGVSAHVELFERARAEGADLLLVHHGLFWGSAPGPIDAALKRRLQLLFDADIALAAYHLPLDAHPEIGNNALMLRALGAEDLRPFAVHRGQPIGFLGRLQSEGARHVAGTLQADGALQDEGTLQGDVALRDEGAPEGEGIPARGPHGLFARVERLTGRQPLVFDYGPKTVRTVAIVTGAGTDHLPEAIAAGADAFVTGEPAERAMAQAAEGGIHFLAAGHHATETFGIRRLGEHLAERFGLKHVFVDVKNPI
jgi:dinuclear metal center YbgI/SA1388 family protein